ncbi:MAG: SRPBCC family protein [Frankia sp.]
MADDTFVVERTTTIKAPAADIYRQIADFHQWIAWSPWEGVDQNLQRTYSGADSGPGAAYAWSGNRKAGRGRMKIADATEPSTVGIDLTFEKPFKARNQVRFTIRPDGSGSTVIWSMTGRKTVMSKVMGIFVSMDKLVGKDFEKGLASLKAVTENSPPA